MVLSVSWTTRERHKGVRRRVSPIFTAPRGSSTGIAKGGFLKYAGDLRRALRHAARDYVAQRMREGKNVVLEIETKGCDEGHGSGKDVISIYLLPPP